MLKQCCWIRKKNLKQKPPTQSQMEETDCSVFRSFFYLEAKNVRLWNSYADYWLHKVFHSQCVGEIHQFIARNLIGSIIIIGEQINKQTKKKSFNWPYSLRAFIYGLFCLFGHYTQWRLSLSIYTQNKHAKCTCGSSRYFYDFDCLSIGSNHVFSKRV